ncbi:MAG: hypothetical protein Q8R60_14995 [Mycobacteriales bacterium]|nr:hypothetical protein [Mycobacteriales bacterium]
MSALKYEVRRALIGSLTLTGVLVAVVVLKDLGDKAKVARAAEELLTEERWAIETAEMLLPLQQRAQALLDADFPLDQIREALKNRRALCGDQDVLAEMLSRLALAAVSGGATKRGLVR